MRLGFYTPFSENALKAAQEIGCPVLEVDANGWQKPMNAGKKAFEQAVAKSKAQLEQYNISISALAFYEAEELMATDKYTRAYINVIHLAEALGVNTVATIFGRDLKKSYKDNIPLFKKVMTPVAKVAEDKGIRIAFENWTGFLWSQQGFTLAYSPYVWDMMFDAVPSKAIGLEFDPSHLYWQQIDYVAMVKEFGDRIYHVHAKDTQMFYKRLQRNGIFSDGCFAFRIPGHGEVDWHRFFAALIEVGFDGDIAIENEDRYFQGDRFFLGQKLGYNFLKPMII